MSCEVLTEAFFSESLPPPAKDVLQRVAGSSGAGRHGNFSGYNPLVAACAATFCRYPRPGSGLAVRALRPPRQRHKCPIGRFSAGGMLRRGGVGSW